jgi:hypothetical protein
MAAVIPFPLIRRKGLVWRQAQHALSMKPESCERQVKRSVQQQRDRLTRIGIDPIVIDRECSQLEGAIRAAMWQLTMGLSA